MLSFVAFVAIQAAQGLGTFPQAVLTNFDHWDANHDGVLTPIEIDQAALDSKYHGPEAAALAALHMWLSAAGEAANTEKLDKAWFTNYKPTQLVVPKDTPTKEAKAMRKAYSASPGSLQRTFTLGVRRLNAPRNNDLFDANGPDFTDIKQGALGDCYFLAPLGAVAKRNPDDIRNMIKPGADGYIVKWGDGKEVKVAPLTDVELAMGGSGTKQGLWIRVIEKAYGSRVLTEGSTKQARDSMNGGSSAVAGKAFTNHKFAGIKLISDFSKEVTDEELNPILTKIRTDLPPALAAHRLAFAGTALKGMPKSISPNHAYAVFEFDPATDRITLWNPHGTDFKLVGDEGFTNGYARTNGVFSLPLKDFARTFGRLLIEEAP